MPSIELPLGCYGLRRRFYSPSGGGKQSTWPAVSGSLAHLRAWPAPTFDQGRPADSSHETVRPENASVAAVWALCTGFGAVVEGAPGTGISAVLGPV